MNIEDEIFNYNVSRETYDKIDSFVKLLTEWNQKMNLVSKNSLADVWVRHVLDSAQLMTYLPTDLHHLVDIGSGAGFPAIVLAVVLAELLFAVSLGDVAGLLDEVGWQLLVAVRAGGGDAAGL